MTALNVTTQLAVRISPTSTVAPELKSRLLSTIKPSFQAELLVIPRFEISIETSTVPISFVSSIFQILSSLETGPVAGRFVVTCESESLLFHHMRKSLSFWLVAFPIVTIASLF